MTPSTADVASLRQKVAGGLGWKLVGQIVAQGSRTLVAILLAHLLAPRDFGLAAMGLIFVDLANIFTDLSLSSALIQRRSITEADRSTVFWTSLGAGAVMTLIGLALAPLAALFFSTSSVTPLFATASVLIFIWAIGGTQMALLTRDMNFRSIELRTIGATLVGAAVGVSLALVGAGPWAIIGQSLSTATTSVILVWRFSSWRPKRIYSGDSLRTLGSFGIKTVFSRILGYMILNTDNLLIGRYLGSAALGAYAVAYNVMVLPTARVAQPIQSVFYSAFARLQADPSRLGRAWIRGTQLVSAINVPAFLGLAVVAPDFVPVVLGPRWHSAVPVLQLLCFAGLVQSFQVLDWSVIQALGRPGRVLRIMAFSAAIIIPAFVIGLRWGIVGVAGSYAVARAISTAVFTWSTCRTLELPIAHFVRGVSWVVLLSLPMVVAVYSVRIALISAAVPEGLRLAICVLVGIGVYAALLVWRSPELVRDLRELVRRRSYAA